MKYKVVLPVEHDLVRYEIDDAIDLPEGKDRDALLECGAIRAFDEAPHDAEAKADVAEAKAAADAAKAEAKAAADAAKVEAKAAAAQGNQ